MIVTGTEQQHARSGGDDFVSQTGETIADALVLLRKARKVALLVPHGFGRYHYSHCFVTKVTAKRWLTHFAGKPEAKLHSSLVHYDTGKFLFLGRMLDQTGEPQP
jgi:hypothetical protein